MSENENDYEAVKYKHGDLDVTKQVSVEKWSIMDVVQDDNENDTDDDQNDIVLKPLSL